MIRFNLPIGKYRVSVRPRGSWGLVFLLEVFLGAWIIMLAYGAVVPKFVESAPLLGYLDILAPWVAMNFIIGAIVRSRYYEAEIEVKREDD